MTAVRLIILIVWQLLAVLGSELAALDDIPIAALLDDGECRDGAPGPCALNALQYRAQRAKEAEAVLAAMPSIDECHAFARAAVAADPSLEHVASWFEKFTALQRGSMLDVSETKQTSRSSSSVYQSDPTAIQDQEIVPARQGGLRNFGYKPTRPRHQRLLRRGPKSTNEETKLGSSELPKHHDWRNINGQSLVLGVDMDEDQSLYASSCGNCYIFATLSTLSDRIKILRKGAYPDVTLSRQAVLSCLPNGTDGEVYGCSGGDPYVIHQYLYNNKIPDATCLRFTNKETTCPAGGAMELCEFCMGPALPKNLPKNFSMHDSKFSTVPCFHVPSKAYPGYGVSDYGQLPLNDELAMMKEIYENGPITCSLVADDPFTYTGQYLSNPGVIHEGVYISQTNFSQDEVNHIMEVTGWGETASGRKYWVLRNSWGTAWANMGWTKLERGVDAQLIESSGCDWAIPDFDELEAKLKMEHNWAYHESPPRQSIDESIDDEDEGDEAESGDEEE
eukprot:TRINITY_DN76781_c0_g1_i1.p1 TRINITY_DN76781_c0_g1~~TRINITY_DN76781_c0_g1_i1.p1  ORF type:complete len:506 (+),score=69.13 TRINITY_DN76781_c0_g1_i1:65-1582(+)